MKKLRLLLYPFALIYGCVVCLRNWFFSLGVLKSLPIPGKSITIGNLSVGGTGKSPLTEYLIAFFLESDVSVTTLSRGYGRKTKGFLEVFENDTAEKSGDEPLMYKRKFGSRIHVVVCEERGVAVEKIRQDRQDLILLDDAFQHRKVQAGINILLTTWSDPFFSDHLLPAGNLREGISGLKRAQLLIVTKCPSSLSEEQKENFLKHINFNRNNVYFATVDYAQPINPEGKEVSLPQHVLLVTGIANPSPLFAELQKTSIVEHLRFPDHHVFNTEDLQRIHDNFDTFASSDKAIITTEKDFVRISSHPLFLSHAQNWIIQPIEVKIDRELDFKKRLKEYVTEI
jgi:tetraacyldisaccharide 4'-kinase